MGRIIEQHFTLLGKLSKCNYCLWSLTKLSKKSLDKELQYKHLLFNHKSVLQSSQNSSSQNDDDDDDDQVRREIITAIPSTSDQVRNEIMSAFPSTSNGIQESPSNSTNTIAAGHSCLTCSKNFRSKWHLNRHMKIHIKVEANNALEEENVVNQEDLPETRQVTTEAVNPPIEVQSLFNNQCLTCSKIFSHKWKLERHMKIHVKAEASRQGDEVPNQEYSTEVAEVNPEAAPSNPTNTCLTCSKVFSQKSSLVRHMKIHVKAEAAHQMTKRKEYSLSHLTYPASDNTVSQRAQSDNYEENLNNSVESLESSEVHPEEHGAEVAAAVVPSHACFSCPKIFKTKRWLDRHILSHVRAENNDNQEEEVRNNVEENSTELVATANPEDSVVEISSSSGNIKKPKLEMATEPFREKSLKIRCKNLSATLYSAL